MPILPPTLTLIRELIAIPSVSCVNPKWDHSNQTVIEQLANWCDSLGFHCEILPIPNHPGKFNLLATLGSGTDGLVLAGHTDTVPYDEQQWRSDPFQLLEADNRLYGLGTADMKSFFALVLTAVAQLETRSFQHPLTLIATADEESSMCGAQALVKSGRPQARHAIIGEPTSLRPVRMHKGILMESIRLTGLSGHSSQPALGNSALEGMLTVMTELLNWRSELQAAHFNPLFDVPIPTLNLGVIQGGDNPNRICGDCELQIDLRLLPGMGLEESRRELQQRLNQVLKDRNLKLTLQPLFEGIAAMETSAQTEIVQVTERLTQQSAQAVAFGTEAPYLKSLGMETVILGPGDIAQAHQPNEFVALNQLQPTITILTQLIRHFCLT